MSRKRSEIMQIKGGVVRVKCSRCNKVRYFTVQKRFRTKNLRCVHCGKVMRFTIENRLENRESCTVLAKINGEINAVMCNVSLSGVGFILSKGSGINYFALHAEYFIEFNSICGRVARKIKIVSIKGNRIGAQYKKI